MTYIPRIDPDGKLVVEYIKPDREQVRKVKLLKRFLSDAIIKQYLADPTCTSSGIKS